jgi:hypothetical protein
MTFAKGVAHMSLAEKPAEPFREKREDVDDHWRAFARLIDDLDQDPLPVLNSTGLHDAAESLRRPALAADHLAAIGLRDRQLQNYGLIVFLVLADRDLIGLVDQRLGEELEQLLQAMPFAFNSRLTDALGCAP